MKGVSKIQEDIENLREKLIDLIQLKDNLGDPEIIKTSVLLDHALNEYNNDIVRDLGHY